MNSKTKKTLKIVLIALLAVLLIPFRVIRYKDGGTVEYGAVLYKIVRWNRLISDDMYDGIYARTSFYLFPDSMKSIDELWETEQRNI